MHLAATYDGSKIRLYINGVFDHEIDGPAAIASNALPLGIGAQSDGASTFQGALDDVRVYARALSLAEIEALAGVTPPANHAPVANDDTYGTGQDTLLNVAAPGVLGNDTDADADSLTAVQDTDVSHGSLTLNSNGSFDYTPANGWVGTDSFTYHANDGTDDSNVATVSITTNVDLRGWWQMDEGLGTTVGDSSLYDRTSTVFGAPAWVTGQIGTALEFNGSTDAVTVPDADSLDLTKLTIAAWIRPGQWATQTIVSKATNGVTDGYELTLATTKTDDSSRKVFFRLNQATSFDTYRINATTEYPIDGTWIHVAATFDGTTMKLYVDGVLDASMTVPASVAINDLPLAIGGQAGRFFNGALDDVRVYGRALSDEEIAALAASANTPPVATPDSYSTPQDTALVVPAPGVLGNDTDADSDPLTAVLDTDVSHGSLALAADGSFTYTPTALYSGPDSFTYHANDGTADSNVVTVSLTVTPASHTLGHGHRARHRAARSRGPRCPPGSDERGLDRRRGHRRLRRLCSIRLPAGSYKLYVQGGGQPASWYGGTSKASATDVPVTADTPRTSPWARRPCRASSP